MASLYTRKGSPYWWIKYRKDGQTRRESTGFTMSHADTQRAKRLLSRVAADEGGAQTVRTNERLSIWVPQYLEARYHGSPATLDRVNNSWASLSAYLDHLKIVHAAQITREALMNYVNWRLGHVKGGRVCCRNTAILELKHMSVIMTEAVKRGMCVGNPCFRLDLRKEPEPEKPELTQSQIERIRGGIRALMSVPAQRWRAEFLHASFEIALGQGIRLSETKIRLKDVDFEGQVVRLKMKGGRQHWVQLNPSVAKLLKEMRDSGREYTWNLQPGTSTASMVWRKFLKKLGLKEEGVTFHCTRVTFISRMERAGVPETVCMRMVGHSSTTIHRIYRRVHPDEFSHYWARLGEADTRASHESPCAAPSM
jgi:integrase